MRNFYWYILVLFHTLDCTSCQSGDAEIGRGRFRKLFSLDRFFESVSCEVLGELVTNLFSSEYVFVFYWMFQRIPGKQKFCSFLLAWRSSERRSARVTLSYSSQLSNTSLIEAKFRNMSVINHNFIID
jgi:hypothetical protein